MFLDRCDAGRKLAAALGHLRGRAPIVLGLPRGGVEVAHEVALALHAPLDILVVRKIGAPGQPELALGAVVDGNPPQTVWNSELLGFLCVTGAYLAGATAREVAEIARRRRLYRGNRPPLDVAGRVVILVDDGIATGATSRAALQGLEKSGASHIVLAVPVASPDSLESLRSHAHEVVCLETPVDFAAVGQFYEVFNQTSDETVIELIGLSS